jgi:hypothetical protein
VSGAACWWCLATVTTSLPCLRRRRRGFPPESLANQRPKDPRPLRPGSPQPDHQAFVQHAVAVNDHGDGVDAPSCSYRLCSVSSPLLLLASLSTRSGPAVGSCQRPSWVVATGPDHQVHPPGPQRPARRPSRPELPAVDGYRLPGAQRDQSS